MIEFRRIAPSNFPLGRHVLGCGILALGCLLPAAVAQDGAVEGDQMKSTLPPGGFEATGDTAEVRALLEQIESIWHRDPALAEETTRRALALARDLDDQPGVGRSLMILGNLAFTSDPHRAAEYYREAREIFQRVGDERGLISVQQNLGSVFGRIGAPEQALAAFFDALEHLERVGDVGGQASVLNNIGIIHSEQGNEEEALIFYERAIALMEGLDVPDQLVNPLNNAANVLAERENYQGAETYLRRALTISEELDSRRAEAMTAANLGGLFNKQRRHRDALPFLFTAERLSKELAETSYLASVYDDLGKAYMGLGRYDEALAYGNQGLSMAQEMGDISFVSKAHETLSRIYEAAGNDERALAHYRQYTVARDSMFNMEKTEIIAEMQTRYETEEKQRAIERLEQENQIRALRAGRWRIAMFSGVGGLLLLLGFLFSRYRLKQRSNRLLEAKNKEIEAQRADLEESLTENKVLLREVHHRVKNNLQVINSLLNLQADAVSDAPARTALRNTQTRVHAMALIHRFLLRKEGAPRIAMQGYIENLSEFLLRAFDGRASAVRCEVEAGHLTLDADTVVPLGLILNELLSNALEHAFPEREDGLIRVGLDALGDGVYRIRVEDDGIGLPAHIGDGSPTGLGLQLVRQLVRQLDGALDVENGAGARYTLRFHELPAT